jgi:RHS repeat-associated protein
LKRPRKITFSNNQTIEYQYDAAGTKLRQVVSGPSSLTTDYVGHQLWRGGALLQAAHEEGRIVPGSTAGTYRYEWNLTDHLGNLRVAFADNNGTAQAVQWETPGPWGENLPTLSGTSSNTFASPYVYTGHERMGELGVYDAKARVYDPIVPRFWQLDPLAEVSRRFTPYGYVYANPLRFVDPDGMMGTAYEDMQAEDRRRQEEAERRSNNQRQWDALGQQGPGPEPKAKKGTQTSQKGVASTIPTLTTVKPPSTDPNTVVAGGLTLATALAADDATVIGVADDPLIPIVLVGTAIYAAVKTDYLQKMRDEVDRIARRAIGGAGFTYEIVVTVPGTYRDVRGQNVTLQTGDVWKFGETTNGTTRYSQSDLNSMAPGAGLRMVPLYFGNQIQIKTYEKFLIYGYFFTNGALPPGNRIFR